MTIDAYVGAVEHQLTVRRARRGLDDLRQALRELADEVGDEAACREFGSPADYAARLDAEFGADDETPKQRRIFGIPANFRIGEGWWKRVFDPSNPRVLVPHAFGIGVFVGEALRGCCAGAPRVRNRLVDQLWCTCRQGGWSASRRRG